jgi:DNA polymerase III, delta subunit
MMHHAVLLKNSQLALPEALALYGNTDDFEITEITTDTFGIDEARRLILTAAIRPAEKSQRLLVVSFTAITLEAQQALLKVLEEPPASSAFFFLLRSDIPLLPTLASRFSTMQAESMPVSGEVFIAFQQVSPAERITLIASKLAKKDTQWVGAIRTGIGAYLRKADVSVVPEAAALVYVHDHLTTRGASNKMLLEELALTLR